MPGYQVRVAELRQLFNAIDPSPFRERDLDPRAEEFIVEWARDCADLNHIATGAIRDVAPNGPAVIWAFFERQPKG